jgi:phosphoribosyl-AMP cyclohydrolase / phosphoribosyl-ATP pyrophosphohydrolase
MITIDQLHPGDDGLVAAVVQDADTRRVLMVAWMDAEALALTQSTGFAHFWSRSRRRLWLKGETSGNTLRVADVVVDCDRDAVLVSARPTGPTCHTGADTCFGQPNEPTLGAVIDTLVDVIAGRRDADPTVSYTARLLAGGDLVARKVIEEAGELAFAAKDDATGGDRERVSEEAADLLYHLLVLVEASGATVSDVADELRRRMVPGSTA